MDIYDLNDQLNINGIIKDIKKIETIDVDVTYFEKWKRTSQK